MKPMPRQSRRTVVIGVAGGYGAGEHACQDGPEVLRLFGFLREFETGPAGLHWQEVIHLSAAGHAGDAAGAIAGITARLAAAVKRSLDAGHFPLVIGGDHSCAIGTWSGVQASLAGRAADASGSGLGLIWLDAHMDSHSFRTSPSRAIHGMPLACLLGAGIGDLRLDATCVAAGLLLPENVCLIGVRSFEPGEARLLADLGVRVYLMDEVRARGLAAVFREARAQVAAKSAAYGISLDLDALDPAEAPGVGSPVPGGISLADLVATLRSLHDDPRLLALEIVEYNPYRDRQFATARAIQALCRSLLE